MSIASRDRGVRLVSRITRWSAAAAVAFTGIFAIMVAKAQPGKSATTQPSAASQGQTAPSTDSSPPSTAGQDNSGLQPPQSPPAASPGSGQVVSGGS
jgi:hypothetical protein